MARNAKSAARILSVQEQMRKIEEAKLGALQGRLQAIKDEQVALVSAMNNDGALQNLFLDTMAVRMKSLAGKERETEVLVARQAAVVRDEAAREKAAKRLAERKAHEEKLEEEQRQLNDVLDVFIRPKDASLR